MSTIFSTHCARCRAATTVPFTPRGNRPIYCRPCMQKRNAARERRPVARLPPARRMLSMGRKGHFVHDARRVLLATEGGPEDERVRGFVEAVFVRGARQGTGEAQGWLAEKMADGTLSVEQMRKLSELVDRYSVKR